MRLRAPGGSSRDISAVAKLGSVENPFAGPVFVLTHRPG
jgi:hypothetical protein